VGGRRFLFLARHPQNEDADPMIRSEGGSEQVAMEISFMSPPKMIGEANCHCVTQRAPNLPLLGAPTVRDLGLSSPKGG
jgi:hypothetical protein